MKKKRLRKLTLDTMEFCFQPLKEEHLRGITGGGYVSSYTITGGTITNWSYDGYNYAVFTASDGRTIVLEGVHVGSNTYPLQASDTAMYIDEEIRIGSGWNSFSFNDLMHEYGHYLQEQEMSGFSYFAGAAQSFLDMVDREIFGEKNFSHSDLEFEQDATARGNSYAASYYDYPKSY
jgi:hypothetical protein